LYTVFVLFLFRMLIFDQRKLTSEPNDGGFSGVTGAWHDCVIDKTAIATIGVVTYYIQSVLHFAGPASNALLTPVSASQPLQAGQVSLVQGLAQNSQNSVLICDIFC